MTLVLDASALVEFVLGSPRGRVVATTLGSIGPDVYAPELITAESLSALRSLERRKDLSSPRATAAISDLVAVPLRKYPTEPLTARIWSLHGQITVYDAQYVAIAEVLASPLLTGDRRLAGTDCSAGRPKRFTGAAASTGPDCGPPPMRCNAIRRARGR